MNTIKKLREKLVYTQEDLVEKSGLSLRTIQRLEASEKPPKGHSLKMLAQVFGLAPLELQEKFVPATHQEDAEMLSIKFINLSVLACFLFPFGNIILPVYLWRKNLQSKLVNEMGRRIINFQIIWSVILCFSLIVSPFIGASFSASFPLILYVLFSCLAINFLVVCLTARSLQLEKMDFPPLPIDFI